VKVTNLQALAAALPQAWQSSLIGAAGRSNLKVLRMDGTPYPEETHSYAEGLLVIDGCLNLLIAAERVTVDAGEICIVPAGVPHSVAAGSHGTLVILDQ
jgi:quercetin dioxygenase-like cupin family protein